MKHITLLVALLSVGCFSLDDFSYQEINDPNAPMIDPATGLVHLFMQYSPAFPYRPHKISWAHLISSD